jgi:serine/threonine-protein kinase
MTLARWSQVQAIFLEAEALPESAWPEFLDGACSGDIVLRAEVEALLKNVQVTRGAFVRTDPTLPGGPAERSLATGARLGPWGVERLVGRGGMGEVYEARRADGAFELRVAIKLLKRGLDSEALVARFAKERRILAQLDHPNIAHVLDAGVAADGRPFLAMEFVDGTPITEYSRAQALPASAILRLMITVCEAVQAAHAKRIVHRDLKPSNVLVTAQGQVKLLDFGIAKALAEEDADATRLAGEAMALTPSYAAPEQLMGLPATPATDVYALGVILYQLLAERLPHQRAGRSTVEIAARLDKETVERPSTALRKERGRLPEPVRLSRIKATTRDLDLIVLKALRPDPARRYANAQGLADDLQNLLDHRPVQARPDTLLYRTSRLVRRNRGPVAAVAGVVAALTLGLASSLWQAHRATREALTADHVKQFMLDFVREQDRYRRNQSQARTPEELIEQAVVRANTELSDEPAARIEVLRVLGYIAVDTGRINLVRQTLVPLLEYSRQRFGERSVEAGHVLADLADAEYFADRVRALVYAREAVSILRSHGEEKTAKFADLEARLGLLEDQDQGRTAEGEALLRDALGTFTAVLGADNPDTAWARFQLASIHFEIGRDAEAEGELRLAIDQLQRAQGSDAIRLQRPLGLLTQLLVRSGRLREALDTADRGLAIVRVQAEKQDMRLGDALRTRVDVLTAMHRLREADALSKESLAVIPAEAESFVGMARRSVAQLDLAMDRPQQAEALLAQNLDLRRRQDGGTGVDLTALLEASLHGASLAMMGRLDEAQAQQSQALQTAEHALGPSAAPLVELHSELAATLERRGDWPTALEQRRQALDVAAAAFGPSHALWARCAEALAHTLLNAGEAAHATEAQAAEAQALLQRVLAIYQALPDPQPGIAAADLDLGRALLAKGQPDAARPLLTQSLALLEADEGPRPGDLDLARRLASATTAKGR